MSIARKTALMTILLSISVAPTILLDSAPAFAQEAKADPRAEELLNKFMSALTQNSGDMDAAAKAVKPYLHKSKLSKDGSDISPDLRRFSFKKAWEGAKFYAAPVQITRVLPTTVSAIGFKETAEAGTVIKYFIAKKQGVNGMPAPVHVFFPAGGGEPKLSDIGSI